MAQNLRWWQEQNPDLARPVLGFGIAAGMRPGAAAGNAPALSDAYSNVGEELEAEARRRALDVQSEVRFPLPTVRLLDSVAVTKRLAQYVVAGGFVCMLLLLLTGLTGWGIALAPVYGLASLLAARRLQRWLRANAEPVIALGASGIRVNTPTDPNKLLPWDAITAVRSVSWRRRTPALRIEAGTMSVTVPGVLLPIPAEVVAARIAEYAATRGGSARRLDWQDAGIADSGA